VPTAQQSSPEPPKSVSISAAAKSVSCRDPRSGCDQDRPKGIAPPKPAKLSSPLHLSRVSFVEAPHPGGGPPASVSLPLFRSADRRPPPPRSMSLPCPPDRSSSPPKPVRLSAPLPPKAYHSGATVAVRGPLRIAKVVATRKVQHVVAAPPWTVSSPPKAVYRVVPAKGIEFISFAPCGDPGQALGFALLRTNCGDVTLCSDTFFDVRRHVIITGFVAANQRLPFQKARAPAVKSIQAC